MQMQIPNMQEMFKMLSPQLNQVAGQIEWSYEEINGVCRAKDIAEKVLNILNKEKPLQIFHMSIRDSIFIFFARARV